MNKFTRKDCVVGVVILVFLIVLIFVVCCNKNGAAHKENVEHLLSEDGKNLEDVSREFYVNTIWDIGKLTINGLVVKPENKYVELKRFEDLSTDLSEIKALMKKGEEDNFSEYINELMKSYDYIEILFELYGEEDSALYERL